MHEGGRTQRDRSDLRGGRAWAGARSPDFEPALWRNLQGHALDLSGNVSAGHRRNASLRLGQQHLHVLQPEKERGQPTTFGQQLEN